MDEKHWKGYMVLIAIITVLSLLPDIVMVIYNIDFKASVASFRKKMFSKKEEEDM